MDSFDDPSQDNQPSTLNPWRSMWTQPRATMQQIVDSDPDRHVLLLAAIAGMSHSLDNASMNHTGDTLALPVIFMIAILLGPIGGIIGLYVGAALLGWTGKWIGGKADFRLVRSSMAWSNVILVWTLLLWIPLLGLFGKEIFMSEMPTLEGLPTLGWVLVAVSVVELVLVVWMIVVFLKCLGQVQGFSAWLALGNVILAFIAFIVIALFVGGGIFFAIMMVDGAFG